MYPILLLATFGDERKFTPQVIVPLPLVACLAIVIRILAICGYISGLSVLRLYLQPVTVHFLDDMYVFAFR